MKKSVLFALGLCVAMAISAQVTKTVEISEGGLSSSLTDTEKQTVTDLTITGQMNGNDFYTLRYHLPAIKKVDISAVNIPNRMIPYSAFYNMQNLEEVIVPQNIRIFDDYAFESCKKLKTVNMPDSLERIEYEAFIYCESLTGPIAFPKGVKLIDRYAFYNCYALSGITLPDSLTEIGYNAFNNCGNLRGELWMPAKLATIGSNAFTGTNIHAFHIQSETPPTINSGCFGEAAYFFVPATAKATYRTNSSWSGFIIIGGQEVNKINVNLSTAGTLGDALLQQVEYLKDVNDLTVSGKMNATDLSLLKNNLPDLLFLNLKATDLTEIPDYQFQNRYYLRNVVLPDSLTRLGREAFYRCNDLQSMIIPDKVKTIYSYSFYDNYELQSIVFPNNLKEIQAYTFMYNYELKELNLPDSLETIGDQAFYQCRSIKKVIIPKKVTFLAHYCFYNAQSLEEIILPDGLTGIGYQALESTKIDSIILPPGLNNFHTSVFSNCSSLKYIKCQQPTPPVLPNDIFYNVNKTTCVIEVPFWSVNMYKQANVWSGFATVNTFNTELKNIPISGPLSLVNNARPTGFPNIQILSTGSLTVGGNTPFPTDIFAIEQRANAGVYGSLVNQSPAMTSNLVKVKVEVNGGRWYFLSFPFDVKVSDIKTDNSSLFAIRQYNSSLRASNGTGGSWVTMTADSILQAGQGYIYNCNNTCNLIIQATSASKNQVFNPENISLALKAYPSEVTANKNWNFTGNVNPAFYDSRYLSYTAPITVWNSSNNTYTAISLIDDKYALKPFEAFFVQKPEDIQEIVFVKEGKQITSTLSVNGPVKSPAALINENRKIINLQLSDNLFTDQSRIVINPQASGAYEINRDASKFMSNDVLVPQLWSIGDDNTQYAINEMPLGNNHFPLGYFCGTAGQLKISAVDFTVPGEKLILIDQYQKKVVEIGENEYSFYSDEGTFIDRFVLEISFVIDNNDEREDERTFISTEGRNIFVHTPTGTDITIYSLNGASILHFISQKNETTIPVSKGVYLVKIGNETFKSVVF